MRQPRRELMDVIMLGAIGWLFWFALQEQRVPLPDGRFIERQDTAAGYWLLVGVIVWTLLASIARLLRRLLPPERHPLH